MDGADPSLIGRTIAGKFIIEGFIGGGAMGGVYRARQVVLDKPVAIKVLHRELVRDPMFTARFQREAKAASRLDHPNSMRVLDYGQEPDGLCYIAMELLDGRSLFQVIREDDPLGTARIVDIFRQTLAALAVAHEMGVVHRDLKPENIIVITKTDDEGKVSEVVKVCDFGIAKMSASRTETDRPGSEGEKLTSHGVVVGTPEYMSPEQGRGEPLDARSDLYAMGVILYQLLTGRVPFSADTAIAVLLKHLIEAPVPPSRVRTHVDSRLEAICMKALSKSPDDRQQSAREMRTELRSVVVDAATGGRDASGNDWSGEVAVSRVTSSAKVPLATQTATSQAIPRRRGSALARLEGRSLTSTPPPPPRQSLLPVALSVLLVAGLLGGAVLFVRGRTPVTVASQNGAGAQTATPTPTPTTTVTATTPSVTATSRPAGTVATSAPSAKPPSVGQPFVPPPVASPPPVAPPFIPPPPPTPTQLTIPVAPDPWASGASPQNPPAAAGAFGAAHVVVGAIRGASSGDVANALPVGTFNKCYRDGLRARGTATSGAATLHLDLDGDGFVTQASFAGPEALAQNIGQCIASSAAGSRVHNLAVGTTGADVDLSFRAE